MNNKEKLSIIYQRFLQNSATRNELEELFTLLNECDEPEIKAGIENELERYAEITINAEAEHQIRIVRASLLDKINNDNVVPMRKRRTWLYAAACIAALITISTWFGINKYAKQQDMLPGGYSAMLSVDGHTKVNPELWASGKAQRVGGVIVTKQANGNISFSAKETDTVSLNHINTITTPKGGQYRVTLSDSTVVKRNVKLKGEAYFEVTKNKHKPFIVSTDGEDVQVLGTKFDITNFEEDEGPITTLIEGSVKVSTPTAFAMLKPGQQSRLNKGAIAVADIDANQFSSWKDGKFDFENASLVFVMHKLSRWYNFDIDYSKLPAHNFYISISRYSKLSDVLHMMTLSSGVKFKIDERRVTIMQ
jgi:transmembrane sensor